MQTRRTFLGSVGAAALGVAGGAALGGETAAAEDGMEPEKEYLEKQTAQWALLARVEPMAAPGPNPDGENDERILDEQLRQLSSLRDRRDEVFGHLALQFQAAEGWLHLGFASYGHYCVERLGLSQRTVEQRAWLERRLYALPRLRQAIREGRLSYEKARLVARYADGASVEGLIERAEQMTCIELRRQLDANQDAQMCARGEFRLVAPRRVRALLYVTFRAARKADRSRASAPLAWRYQIQPKPFLPGDGVLASSMEIFRD